MKKKESERQREKETDPERKGETEREGNRRRKREIKGRRRQTMSSAESGLDLIALVFNDYRNRSLTFLPASSRSLVDLNSLIIVLQLT